MNNQDICQKGNPK